MKFMVQSVLCASLLSCHACATYSTQARSSEASYGLPPKDPPKNCNLIIGDNFNSEDQVKIQTVFIPYAKAIQPSLSPKSAGSGLDVKISNVHVSRGASFFDLLTGLSLGIIPSWHVNVSKYEVRIIDDADPSDNVESYEIHFSVLAWLPVLPFAYWPKTNRDRLASEFEQIFRKHCVAFDKQL